jgi:hypothetical protein
MSKNAALTASLAQEVIEWFAVSRKSWVFHR